MTTNHPPHWTDGTTHDGQTDYGPPPLPGAWKPGEECQTALIDPPGLVWVTVHFSDGSSAVFQYVGSAPGMFPADVAQYVAGKDGTWTLTWNIGTGSSEPFEFHCAPEPTTTTTAPQTTTTTVPEATSTTTTSFDPGTPATVPLTTTTALTGLPRELPNTGSSNVGLAGFGGGLVAAGCIAVIWARHFRATK